ncbi:hypothetical protein AGABI1DRAFT_129206 [Agaricus bisporus var. burnettii JB137-S8]|uniref:Uncharacterized protein n=1 Tax=Agaricus bisporus var. burnettii (strain JB137-S8 / ATCC MYA-4627 / FGSC 10392) TaxID=597362 RepID=K5VWT2_AGABU|nr:uncharacterized protein AGABI1DRAFT_129206 [Agaricus bisporus var. burnettii JB137-S8]EKM78934.1 hypothetical protein AGABI1DRAFT_129206 [Agaricus bisporus var. burnettii JB137-S8]
MTASVSSEHTLLPPSSIEIMAMHPELEEAFNTGLSMPEVFKIFTKHHSGLREERIDVDSSAWDELVPAFCAFWDNWKPLFRRVFKMPIVSHPVSEQSMSIHRTLTREIISWLCDSKRRSNVYLVAEPQMPTTYSYRNRRARVFANVCYDAQRFGLPFQNDPDSLGHGIHSLITELAAVYHPYRRIVTREMIDNPGIPKLSTRTLFNKLIRAPWKALQESHPHYTTTPPVVVLHWDSEYLDKELLHSICEFGSSPYSSSLLWIISIDANIKLPIRDLLHPSVPFQYFRLPICYNEGPADVALILHGRFSALRREYEAGFDEDEIWPSEKQMSQLARVVSGLFGFVEVIIQFVDWEDDGGPRAHLETLLAYMIDSPSPSDERPYCALDHFYTRALSNLPPHLLSVLTLAFGILYSNFYRVTSLEFELPCLLSLENDTFLGVLPYLYRFAVAAVVTNDDGYDYNSWFKMFLKDPTRSGQFYSPESESRLAVYQGSLRILSYASNFTAILKLMMPGVQSGQKTWYRVITIRLRVFACDELCLNADSTSSSLRHFDFRCLAHACNHLSLGRFMKFLRRLYLENVYSPSIVRVQPISLLDRQFISKCEGLVEPWDFEEEQPSLDPKYVLLGFESETVLVLVSPLEYDPEEAEKARIAAEEEVDKAKAAEPEAAAEVERSAKEKEEEEKLAKELADIEAAEKEEKKRKEKDANAASAALADDDDEKEKERIVQEAKDAEERATQEFRSG